MTYNINIADTAITENGVRIVFVAGTDAAGRSFSATFDAFSSSLTEVRYLPDIPGVDATGPVAGWQTFIKMLTGDGDYLCEPGFSVADLDSGLIYEGLSDWLKENAY